MDGRGGGWGLTWANSEWQASNAAAQSAGESAGQDDRPTYRPAERLKDRAIVEPGQSKLRPNSARHAL
jgi:hypothetical protein